jgi:adenosine 3'-phospho 5'-phosphosulfate transporter B2
MTIPYGDGGGQFFKYSLFLVLCNRVFTCLTALAVSVWRGEKLSPVAPLYSYASVSFSNVLATSCQYEALKYVTFPVQTLAKTAKTVPVMVWGTVILLKRYGWKEYAMAVAVTGGCTLFLLSGQVSTKVSSVASQEEEDQLIGGGGEIYGGLLMLTYLGFDGFTSTFQEKLFKGYEMSSQHQVLYVTLFSSSFAFISLVGANMLYPALTFVVTFPECVVDILLLSGTAVTSQFVIAYTIKKHGALVFATIMTTRQFLSILLSSFIFQHPLVRGQWLGLLVVFGTLYLKIIHRQRHKQQRREEGEGEEDNISIKVLNDTTTAAAGKENSETCQ